MIIRRIFALAAVSQSLITKVNGAFCNSARVLAIDANDMTVAINGGSPCSQTLTGTSSVTFCSALTFTLITNPPTSFISINSSTDELIVNAATATPGTY